MHILKLYVESTTEQDTYDTLKNRINLFEEAVGPLQPTLAEMPRILPRMARAELELDEARRVLDQAVKQKSRLPIESQDHCIHYLGQSQPSSSHDVTTAKGARSRLTAWCLAHPAPGMWIVTVPEPGTQSHPRMACAAARRWSSRILHHTWGSLQTSKF